VSAERVILWRHGRTPWNAQGRIQGQADPPLDEVGAAEARAAAALLAGLPITGIISSDLRRAAATAEALGARTGLPVRLDQRLRERSAGALEGLTRAEVAERFPQDHAAWASGREMGHHGGETLAEAGRRALELFQALPREGVIVLVTHSATALALTGALLGLTDVRHVLVPLANCHWSELLRQDDGRYRLRAHNAGPPGVGAPGTGPAGGAAAGSAEGGDPDGDDPNADPPDVLALDPDGR
jgi:probable phosphoglycerate mutase